MADDRLRELERAWLQTGDPEQGERYLRARFRAGTIDWPRIEAAAYLGDSACQRLLGEDALAFEPGATKSLNKFVEGLVPYGSRHPGLHRRIMLGIVRGASRDVRGEANAAAVEAAVDAVEVLLGCPCADHAEAAQTALRDVQRSAGFWEQRLLRSIHGELSDIARGDDSPHARRLLNRVRNEGWDPQHVREGIATVVEPWLLAETAAEPPDWQRDAPFLEGPEQFEALTAAREARLHEPASEPLYHGGPLTREQAEAVLEFAPVGKLSTKDATRIIAAYYHSLGWKLERSRLLAPSGQRRFVLKDRVVVVEEKDPEAGWRRKPTHYNRSVRSLHVAQLLVDAARRPGPSDSEPRGRTFQANDG